MQKMTAAILEEADAPIKLKQTDMPTAYSGEAIVRIHAAALNHRDVWIKQGKYAGLRFPIILGSDGAGEVVEVGNDIDSNWVGKEVIIDPSLNWGGNPRAHGSEFRILGLPDNGTFAEYVKVPVRQLHLKPEVLSYEEAAAVPLAGVTAFRVLFTRAKLQPGEKVLITGIGGGVAKFCMQFALAAGAEVFVTSGSADKISEAVGKGASGGENYKRTEWAKELKKQAGNFDVIVDSAGGAGFSNLLDLASPGGRIAIYGGTLGAFTAAPQKIFWKQLDILGSTMGTSIDFSEMVEFIQFHRIIPIIDTVFPFEDINKAFQRMEQGEQSGKIVVKI